MEASNATTRILILGGTTEARLLAERLAGNARLDVIVSFAGRTRNPAPLPARMRSGGFGGAAGLAAYLRKEQIAALVDATHPFAALMPFHAAQAAQEAGIPLLALVREPWRRRPGDRWRAAGSVAEAVAALGDTPRRVFAALGRNEAAALEAAPQHAWLLRSVDPIAAPLDLPDVRCIEARGPFAEQQERQLLIDYGIDAIIAKNSGGEATYGKLAAARALGIEVMLVERPQRPHTAHVASVADAAQWVEDHGSRTAERGV